MKKITKKFKNRSGDIFLRLNSKEIRKNADNIPMTMIIAYQYISKPKTLTDA